MHAPAEDVPVATGPNFAYFGVKDDTAHLVEWLEEGLVGPVSETEVKLSNGQVVKISRGESQTSIFIPAACLDDLAGRGRTLLGVG